MREEHEEFHEAFAIGQVNCHTDLEKILQK